jgi:hypothetical protein
MLVLVQVETRDDAGKAAILTNHLYVDARDRGPGYRPDITERAG